MKLFIPEKAEIELSTRSKKLRTDKSWALQGQPFYSGGVTYKMNVVIPEKGQFRLVLPKVRDVVSVEVNGSFAGKKIKPPYSIPVELNNGNNELKITVYNSLANALECFLEEGGILEGGYVIKE